jgi:hypothetical protein
MRNLPAVTTSGSSSWRAIVWSVEQITVAADRIEIRLGRVNVAAALEAGGRSHRPDLDPVAVSIDAKLRRAGKGKRLVPLAACQEQHCCHDQADRNLAHEMAAARA